MCGRAHDKCPSMSLKNWRFAIYVTSLRCSKKKLKVNLKFLVSFFLSTNSSGATSLNYHGNCSVRIYHVCREVTTRVRTIKFEFMDGEVIFVALKGSCYQHFTSFFTI